MSMDRSDFDKVFDEAGPPGLTSILRSRLGDTARLDKELHRMSRSGKWLVIWDKESGEGKIAGRIANPPSDDPKLGRPGG